jgi:hypothetical protein
MISVMASRVMDWRWPFFAIPRLWFVLEHDNFRSTHLLHHACHDCGAVHHWMAVAQAAVVRYEQYLGQLDGLTFRCGKLLDLDHLAWLHAVLLTTGLDNRERHSSFLRAYGA